MSLQQTLTKHSFVTTSSPVNESLKFAKVPLGSCLLMAINTTCNVIALAGSQKIDKGLASSITNCTAESNIEVLSKYSGRYCVGSYQPNCHSANGEQEALEGLTCHNVSISAFSES